jgi:polyhydroxyalkanoate synthase
MDTEYLHYLFLRNGLFEGRYHAGGRPVALGDTRVPLFMVATARNHVAPWHSVYKLNLVAETELTFLLTSGGHNAGIVSEPRLSAPQLLGRRPASGRRVPRPGHLGRQHPGPARILVAGLGGLLAQHSTGRVAPPTLGAPDAGYPSLADTPGATSRSAGRYRSCGATRPILTRSQVMSRPKRKPPTWAKKATPPPLAEALNSPKLASMSW